MQRREVRGLVDDRLLLRRAFADQAADHRQPGGDPDPRLERDGFDIEAGNSVDVREARPYRPFGFVLMRLRVAEIHPHPIAHVPGDKTVGFGDYFGGGAVRSGDDLAIIFGIEAC
jgi:hypothetical protein